MDDQAYQIVCETCKRTGRPVTSASVAVALQCSLRSAQARLRALEAAGQIFRLSLRTGYLPTNDKDVLLARLKHEECPRCWLQRRYHLDRRTSRLVYERLTSS